MVGVTAEGYGWDFIWQNLQNFMGNSMLWYFFPALVLFVLVARNKEYRVIGFYPYLIFVITVCNPYLITIAGSVIGLADRYYRFFWLLPLGLMFGVAMVRCLQSVKKIFIRGAVCSAALLVIVLLGTPPYLGQAAPEYVARESEYFNGENIVRISEELHEHGIAEPVVAYPETLLYDLCQYDPYHISIFTREEIPRVMNTFSMESLQQVIADQNYEMIVKYVFLSGWIDQLTSEQLREAFTKYRVDYFVIPESQSQVLEYYEAAGCVISGHTDGYYIVYTQID